MSELCIIYVDLRSILARYTYRSPVRCIYRYVSYQVFQRHARSNTVWVFYQVRKFIVYQYICCSEFRSLAVRTKGVTYTRERI